MRSDHASAGRVIAWERSLDVFATKFEVFAVGVGLTNREAVFHLIGAYGAHNEYIDSVFRMGVLGPIALLFVTYTLFKSYWRLRCSQVELVRYIGSTMVAVVTANVAIGLTQGNFLHDYSGYTCWLYMYLLYGVTANTSMSIMSIEQQELSYANSSLNGLEKAAQPCLRT